MRSGTLDVAGDRRRSPWRSRPRSRAAASTSRRGRRAARRPDRAVRAAVPDVDRQRRPGRRPAARQRALLVPRLRGRRLLMLLDARASSARRVRPARPGCAQPSHVLLAMGVGRGTARGSLRFSLGPHVDPADVDALAAAIGPVRRAGRARAGSASQAARDTAVRPVRVLAAMSGGVDSAVAAARAVDAGHDVDRRAPGAVAQARSTLRTGARGCCTLEDARDARRAADLHRASRSTSGTSPSGSTRTWSTTSSPSTRPGARRIPACAATSRSSSRRCWTGRSRSGFDAVVHRALRPAATADGLLRAAPAPTWARTSRTCWRC